MVLRILFAVAMLSSVVPSPVLAQTLQDHHCTGKPDVPDDQQITGCGDAADNTPQGLSLVGGSICPAALRH